MNTSGVSKSIYLPAHMSLTSGHSRYRWDWKPYFYITEKETDCPTNFIATSGRDSIFVDWDDGPDSLSITFTGPTTFTKIMNRLDTTQGTSGNYSVKNGCEVTSAHICPIDYVLTDIGSDTYELTWSNGGSFLLSLELENVEIIPPGVYASGEINVPINPGNYEAIDACGRVHVETDWLVFEYVYANNSGYNTNFPVYLPFDDASSYNIKVDWGDGSPQEIFTTSPAPPSHIYPQSTTVGTLFIVYVRGLITDINSRFFGSFLIYSPPGPSYLYPYTYDFGGNITRILWSGNQSAVNLSTFNMANSSRLSYLPKDLLKVSNVTSLENSLLNTINLNSDLSEWDVSNVTNFRRCFYGSAMNNNSISNWDLSSAPSMGFDDDGVWQMFANSPFNQPISFKLNPKPWGLLNDAQQFNSDVSGLDVSNCIELDYFFHDCESFNHPSIREWKLDNCLSLKNMFSLCTSFNIPLDTWDTGNVQNFAFLFSGCDIFNQDLSSWDTSSATSMSGMFQGANAFNGDITNWDVSNVTTMREMFDRSAFNQDIGNWDVSNVADMSNMFEESAFNQDISNWDVSNVTDMLNMFKRSAFNQDISNWDVSNVTDMHQMFQESAFNQDIGNWDMSGVSVNIENMLKESNMSASNLSATLSGWVINAPQQVLLFNIRGLTWNTAGQIALENRPLNPWTFTQAL